MALPQHILPQQQGCTFAFGEVLKQGEKHFLLFLYVWPWSATTDSTLAQEFQRCVRIFWIKFWLHLFHHHEFQQCWRHRFHPQEFIRIQLWLHLFHHHEKSVGSFKFNFGCFKFNFGYISLMLQVQLWIHQSHTQEFLWIQLQLLQFYCQKFQQLTYSMMSPTSSSRMSMVSSFRFNFGCLSFIFKSSTVSSMRSAVSVYSKEFQQYNQNCFNGVFHGIGCISYILKSFNSIIKKVGYFNFDGINFILKKFNIVV